MHSQKMFIVNTSKQDLLAAQISIYWPNNKEMIFQILLSAIKCKMLSNKKRINKAKKLNIFQVQKR